MCLNYKYLVPLAANLPGTYVKLVLDNAAFVTSYTAVVRVEWSGFI